MASGLTGNEVPGNRLWVRVPCPPLESCQAKLFGRTAGPGVGAAFPQYGWVPKRFAIRVATAASGLRAGGNASGRPSAPPPLHN